MSSDAMSMVSSVLDIESQAEAMLEKAAGEAKQIAGAASAEVEEVRKRSSQDASAQIKQMEAEAAKAREKQAAELKAKGKEALDAIAALPASAVDGGVQYLMGELLKKA